MLFWHYDKVITMHYNRFTVKNSHHWIANLSHFGLIKVSGDQTLTFLQGQLTCDINQLKQREASLGACCNPKGRMMANFYIWRNQNDCYLLLPQSMVLSTIEHFKKYAVFSKVKLTAVNETVIAVTGNLNLEKEASKTIILVLTPQSPTPIHLIVGNSKTMLSFWKNSSKTIVPIDVLEWQAFNIKNGISFIYPQTRGLLTPQMINLQKLGGVSFKKGCYIGQEIIARTEYLGKLKRHLYRAHINCKSSPQPGDELKNKNSQPVGIVVESTPVGNTGFELLTVMQDQLLEKEPHIYYQDHELTLGSIYNSPVSGGS